MGIRSRLGWPNDRELCCHSGCMQYHSVMVKPLLEELRTKVENARGLPDTTKSELLKLVADLESQAAGTAGAVSTEGEHGFERLIASVEGLEASHPDITNLANRIATMLANMGI